MSLVTPRGACSSSMLYLNKKKRLLKGVIEEKSHTDELMVV